MSNAITDILHDEIKKAVLHGREFAGQDIDYPVDGRTHITLQALYEAVKLAIPDEEMMQQKGDDLWTWNDCRAEFLTNLSLLFGVPLGNLDEPEATNSQPQLADNPDEESYL